MLRHFWAAESVLNISEAGWVDSAGDWVINWDWVFTNIELQAKKKVGTSAVQLKKDRVF